MYTQPASTFALLTLVLGLCARHAACQTYKIHHRVLLLSKPGITNTDFLETTLQAYGVPYDLVRISPSNAAILAATAFWYNREDGSGRYSGIFMTPSFEGDGTLNRAQVTAMWEYMSTNNVRMVQIAAWPDSFGYYVGTLSDGSLACTSHSPDATFAANIAAPRAFSASGIKKDVSLNMAGLYICPATTPSGWCGAWASDFQDGLGGPCKVKPVLQTSAVPGTVGYSGPVTTAWTAHTKDGRDLLLATHDCAKWSHTCLVFGHFALAWVTKGIIPGYRRLTLNAQVDDMFLATDTDHKKSLRINTDDLAAHKLWHDQISSALPAGSTFRTELALNGVGILKGNSTAAAMFNINNEDCASNTTYAELGCDCYLMDYRDNACTSSATFCQQCQKNWPKPNGSGTTQLLDTYENYTADWDKTALMLNDPLFANVASNTEGLADAFFWCHHTFTHMNLDNATREDAAMQMLLNKEMAGPDFLGFSGANGRATWSDLAMVTPQISGLSNGDALRGLYDTGIRAVMGDNTFDYLMNAAKPYQMQYTTAASSNYDGFLIIPRYATEIFFNTSTAAENLKLYKAIYPDLATPSFQDILEREAARVVHTMLQLRHDAHMFHQANLNTNGTDLIGSFGQPASLLMAWVERIVAEHNKFTTWPVVSVKADDLFYLFKTRQARDDCNFDYTLNINSNTGVLQTLSVGSLGHNCAVPAPLIMPDGATLTGASKEQLGSDPATWWAAASGSDMAVTGNLVWGDQ